MLRWALLLASSWTILLPPASQAQESSSPPLVNAVEGVAEARLLASEEAPLLSLEDVLTMALRQNPQLAQAEAALAGARARLAGARASGGVDISLDASVNYRRNFGSGGSSSSTGGAGGSSSSGRSSSQDLGVGAVLPLDTSGRIKAGTASARAGLRGQVATTMQVQHDLLLTATLGYLDLLRSQQLLEVARADLKVARERLRVAEVRRQAGAAAGLEVFRAQTDLAASQQREVEAEENTGQAQGNLNVVLGRAPETPLRVQSVSTLDLPPLLVGRGTLLAPEAARQLAAGQRPSLEASRQGISQAEAEVQVARAGRRPSLSLSLRDVLSNPASSAGRFLLTLGLGLTQNLFDSGRTRAQIDQAKAQLNLARSGLRTEELAVAGQIDRATLQLDSARQRLETSDIAVTSARAALRAAQAAYAAGAATALEVTDAQSALVSAETAAVNARFQLAAGQAELAAAVGVLPAAASTATFRAQPVSRP